MISRFNISAGELFELVRPLLFLLGALISTWVLASARKRFASLIAFAWAIATLFLPFVVLPAYLAVIIVWSRPVRAPRWRWLLPLAYGMVVIVAAGLYFCRDSQTVDARLARAVQAKLVEDHAAAIREYRRALTLENNPHTRKLLAIELANAGQTEEAIAEFRVAQEEGEPISCPRDTPKCEEIVKGISGLNR